MPVVPLSGLLEDAWEGGGRGEGGEDIIEVPLEEEGALIRSSALLFRPFG